MDEEFRYNLTATNVCGGSPRPARCLYSLATELWRTVTFASVRRNGDSSKSSTAFIARWKKSF